jgi:uncharacterized membrane protein
MTNTLACRQNKILRRNNLIATVGVLAIIALMLCLTMNFAFAANDYVSSIKDTLQTMISVVCTIFQAVGVILTVYSVGQLVLAFKNEDADSKSRASTMLVVGIVLIAMPSLVTGLNLINKLTGN